VVLPERKTGIIPVVDEELDTFQEEIQAFRRNERGDEFTSFRLHHGVYGQRQADAMMLRVKIPGGLLTSEQLDALGEVAGRFAPLKKGHITTRENVQFHHLKLEDALSAIRLIGEVGLTSREACANTVRNVITSMRLISWFDWAEFVESVSLVDGVLRARSSFGEMDFATRDRYRHAVEELARESGLTELEVARKAADMAIVLWMWASFWVTTWLTRTASAFSDRARATSSGTSTWAPPFTTVSSL